MKNVLKYLSIVSAVLTVVALIVVLCAKGIIVEVSSGFGTLTNSYSGCETLFGNDSVKASGADLAAFIITLVVLVGGVALVVLSFVKPALIEKFSNLAWLVIAVLSVVAAILFFCTRASFISANDASSIKEYIKIGAGPVVAGILSILAGAAAAVNPVLKLLKK